MTTAPAASQLPRSPFYQTAWLAVKTDDRNIFFFLLKNPEETSDGKMLTKIEGG